MTTQTVRIEFTEQQLAAAGVRFAEGDGEKRTLEGVVMPFGTPSGPAMDGYRYQFSTPPENADELIDVVDEHYDAVVVGRLAAPFDATDTQLSARARIFKTTRGNDVLVEAVEGVKTGFSVAAAFDSFDEVDGVRHVTGAWRAIHLGVVRRPAFTESEGFTLAASAHTGEKMNPEQEKTGGVGAVELPTVPELAAKVAEFMADAGRQETHPLARFRNRTEFMAAFQAADEDGREQLAAQFALVDQVTANNPGVMVPGWRTDIKANLDKRRPAIAATGGSISLPDTGMSVSWPYFDGDLDAIIAEQAAEKAELNSVRIDIDKADATIRTAGVASDMSYQLLMRSTPAYLAAYQNITDAGWARYTERVFELALQAASTEIGTALPADLSTAAGADAFWALLFEGSAAVEDATGAPAGFTLAAPDVFLELGGNPALRKTDSNDTANASTLRINVNGLEVTRAPFLNAGTVIMGNESVAKFSETGPMLATEENVARLGRDVATWGMYVPAEVYFPAGLVRFDRTV